MTEKTAYLIVFMEDGKAVSTGIYNDPHPTWFGVGRAWPMTVATTSGSTFEDAKRRLFEQLCDR